MIYVRKRNRTSSKGVAISVLAVAAILIFAISAAQRYFSAASSSLLSGYAPIGAFQDIYSLIVVLFCMFSVAVVTRILVNGMPVRFTSPVNIMTCRAKFITAVCLLLVLASFLSAQDKLSNGNSPEGKAKNYFRFTAEYRNLVMHLPLGLSDVEKEAIDDSLGRKNITQGSFALNNVTVKYGNVKQIRDIARATRNGERIAWVTGRGKAVMIVKTPAAVAFEKATTRTFSLIFLTCAALALYALTCTVKLLAFGHKLWLSFTAGKRNVMKILNLLYYLGYVPMVVVFGFVHSFRKMPSFHGSPGSFARAQSVIRTTVATSLFVAAALVVAEVFVPRPSAQGYVQLIAAAAILSLAITAVRALVWARKARKGYLAEKKVAIDLMDACICSQKLAACLKGETNVDIYWGRKYGYIPGKARSDIASRAAMFLKRVFGKEEKDTADIDLSIKYTMPDDVVVWLVCEIKSYYVGDIYWTKRQAIGNANVVRSEETKDGAGPIVMPVVVSTEWTDGPGSKERYVARLCDDPAKMTVRGLLEMGLGMTAAAAWRRCERDRGATSATEMDIEAINL